MRERSLYGGPPLLWAGLRGDDGEMLRALGDYAGSHSILATSSPGHGGDDVAFETLAGRRPDLEVWDVADHLRTEAGATFWDLLLERLGEPTTVVAYRPSEMLSAACIMREVTCVYLSPFSGLQSAFEFKPWVEQQVGRLGVATVPWQHLSTGDQARARRALAEGALVVRRSRTSGGEGIARVESLPELAKAWPRTPGAIVSVAPFLDGAIPINVGGVAWQDGSATVHLPSLQLVGSPSLTSRPFGYCGNDFGAARELEPSVIDEIERATTAIGTWMAGSGYVGAFGVDFMMHQGDLLFTEVNPRFQGSSRPGADVARSMGHACIFEEHVAAHAGGSPATQEPLRHRVMCVPDHAHFVVHHTGTVSHKLNVAELTAKGEANPEVLRIDVLPADDVVVDPNAVAARITVQDRITTTGFELHHRWLDIVESWRSGLPSAPHAATTG